MIEFGFLYKLIYIGSIILLLVCVRLLVKYADPSVDFKTKFIVFLSWYTNILCVVFFSVDIFNVSTNILTNSQTIVNKNIEDQPEQSQISFIWAWKLIYWINLILNFFVIPVMSEYSVNGYFDQRDKIKYAIKKILIINAVIGVLGLIILVYLVMYQNLKFSEIYLLLISIANCQ